GERGSDQGPPQHPESVGEPGRERDGEHAHHHRGGQHHADLARIESPGGEPCRHERHGQAEIDEEGAVEQRQAQHQSVRHRRAASSPGPSPQQNRCTPYSIVLIPESAAMILPMSDEHSSPSPSAPPPPTDADYEAIAAAVIETVRGRWLLAEYAKCSRNADTELILKGLDRVETLLREPRAVSPAERVRIDLVEMAKAIAQTRNEIAAIRPDGDAKGTLSEATEELDSIVQTTERATSDILAAAEQVQEIAWTLRERGSDGVLCDALD